MLEMFHPSSCAQMMMVMNVCVGHDGFIAEMHGNSLLHDRAASFVIGVLVRSA